MDTNAIWVAASKESRTARATDRLGRIETCEAVSTRCEAVKIWCWIRFGTKAAKVCITKVIGEEEDDVWEAARFHWESIQKTPQSE